jgi:hypothetical protein
MGTDRVGIDTGFGQRLGSAGAPGVESPLLLPASLLAVVSRAAPGGLLALVGLAATEGASQIAPPLVAGISEKINATVPTAGPARSQLRLEVENRSQQRVILEHQGAHRPPTIPIGNKPKVLLDLDCKNPRFWLWMLK